MTIEQQRNEVARAYSSEVWKAKVKRMPDMQVIAIYMRLKVSGKIR